MAEISGQLAAVGRIAIVVSRYHERVTARLLEGARHGLSRRPESAGVLGGQAEGEPPRPDFSLQHPGRCTGAPDRRVRLQLPPDPGLLGLT